MATMTKSRCPFCHKKMSFGLNEKKEAVVEHAPPWCRQLNDNSPKDFLVLATKKILDDTQGLIGSRGGN